MDAEIKVKFNFKGLECGIVDFDYSPPDYGSYWNPPDPEEFVVNKLKVQDTYNKKWYDVPEPVLDWLQEDDDFYTEALDALHKELAEEAAARAADEADYRYELMRDRRMENESAQKPNSSQGGDSR